LPSAYICGMPEQVFAYDQLLAFTKNVFHKIGCPPQQADTAARVLLSADMRGVDSHGVARLSG